MRMLPALDRLDRITIGGLALAALLTSPAAAGERPEASWNRRIGETVAALKVNDAKKALETIDGVLDDMAEKANPGKSADKGFGMSLMLRAVAHSALGDERAAIWDWHLAQQIDPALESWDLREFGAAGETLDRHRLARDPVPAVKTEEEILATGGKKPEIVKRGHPTYGERARKRGWQGKIRIDVVVDVEGIPTYPRVQGDTEDAAMVYETSEFVRALIFKPFLVDGVPTPFRYTLNSSFKLTS
jgi:hypothetical protein